MADDFLLVIISGLTAVMIVLIIQMAISRFQKTANAWSIIRNLMLLINLAIILGLTVGSFYYSLQAGYDDFHVTIGIIFLLSGICGFVMTMLDRKLQAKEQKEGSSGGKGGSSYSGYHED